MKNNVSEILTTKKFIEELSPEVTVLPNGDRQVSCNLEPEMAQKFYKLCNILSEEVGRPLQKDEAFSMMFDRYMDEIISEAAALQDS